jgi:hypothetical protein
VTEVHGFKSWKQHLAEMHGKDAYIRPKVVGPFPGPAQAGATCTGLPFYLLSVMLPIHVCHFANTLLEFTNDFVIRTIYDTVCSKCDKSHLSFHQGAGNLLAILLYVLFMRSSKCDKSKDAHFPFLKWILSRLEGHFQLNSYAMVYWV